MKISRFFIFFLFFALQYHNAFSFDFDIELGVDSKNKKQIFYNEKTDCNDGICSSHKNYAKIGAEEYVQESIFRKFYIGFDFHWYLKRFGDTITFDVYRSNSVAERNPTFYSKELWDRFKNFDIYIGFRVFKYLGFDLGYSRFGNIYSQYAILENTFTYGKSFDMNGIFADVLAYTPPVFLFKKFSVEGYASVGGVVYFSKLNDNKGFYGGKFGVGLLIHIINAFAINVGVDYYYPLKDISKQGTDFSNKGLLSIKTGFNFYLNI